MTEPQYIDPLDEPVTWSLGEPPSFTWPPLDDDPHYSDHAQGRSDPTPAAHTSTPDGNESPPQFTNADVPDGLVFTSTELSPELQWQQNRVDVPLPPVRERPQPRVARPSPSVQIWQPAADHSDDPTRAEIVRRVLMTLAPVAVIVLLAIIAMSVARMYGLT